MSVLKYDKVVLKKEFKSLKTVGEIYEIANITDTSFILRDAKKRIAVAVIDIKDFEEYFEPVSEVREWCPWTTFQTEGSVIGFYRTNGKKVEVRWNGYKSAAYCNKVDDFNLHFGITLAYRRCIVKFLTDQKKQYEKLLSVANGELKDNKNLIKNMIFALEEKFEKEHE